MLGEHPEEKVPLRKPARCHVAEAVMAIQWKLKVSLKNITS